MATNTGGGTTTSFSNTPQAQDDLLSKTASGAVITEDTTLFIVDVMANDLGGNAKVLWSLDDGASASTATKIYAPADLLAQDTARVESMSTDYSAKGAHIWITADGKVGYDTASFSAAVKASLQALAVGETLTDTFTYAIRLGNGTLSWATVSVAFAGTNDIVSITSGSQAGTVTEDADTTASSADSLCASGTVAFADVDLSDTHTAMVAAAAGNATALGALVLAPVNEAANAANGSVQWTYTLNNAAAQYLAQGQTVTETYVITINDGHGSTAAQNVVITITGTNDAPVITNVEAARAGNVTEAGNADDGAAVAGTSAVSGQLSASDVDTGASQTWSIQGAAATTYGNFAVNAASGQWTYTLDNNLSATQALAENESVTQTYTVRVTDDFGAYADQTVTITINGTNDSPVITTATGANEGAVTEAGNLDDGSVAAGNADASGTLSSSDVDSAATATWSGNATGAYGSFAINAGTGSWTYTLHNANTDTDALAEGASVTDSFTATVTDEFGATATQVVTIAIAGTNDSPVITNTATALLGSVTAAGNEDDGVAVAGTTTVSGQLSADDVDTGTAQTWSIQGTPSTTYGSLAINAATGEWTYTLDNAGSGTQALKESQSVHETYIVRVTDDFDAYVDQTVTITINGTNDVPVITNAATALVGSVTEAGNLDDGTTVAGTSTISGQLSASDVDADASQSWAIQGAAPATYGSFAVNASTGKWTYTLDNTLSATQALKESESVTQTYTVRVTDDFGAYVDQTVTITVNGTNDSPVAVADTNAGDAVVESGFKPGNTPFAGGPTAVGNVLANDTDVDAEATRTVSAVNGTSGNVGAAVSGTYGAVNIASDGSYTYTLDNADTDTNALAQGASATDVFNYNITDEFGAVSSSTLTINITGTNDAPVAVADVNSGQGPAVTYPVPQGSESGQPIQTFVDPGNLASLVSGAQAAVVSSVLAGYENFHEAAGINDSTYGNPSSWIPNGGGGGWLKIDLGSERMIDMVTFGRDRMGAFNDREPGQYTISVGTSENIYASGDNSNDAAEYVQVYNSASVGFSGIINGTETITSSFALTTARYLKIEFTGSGLAIDEVQVYRAGVSEAGVNPGNTAYAGDPSAVGNVLTNDTDVDGGDTKMVTTTGTFTGIYGLLSLAAGGGYTYTLNNGDSDTNALAQGQSASDVFNYRMRDTAGATSSSTLTINITGTNDRPVAVADTNAGDAVTESGVNPGNTAFAGDTTAAGNVLINDTDADSGDTKTVTTTGTFTGNYGSLTLQANGSYTYTLNNADTDTNALAQGQSASDVFNYTMRDTSGATSSSTLTIAITGTNDIPVAATADVTGAVIEQAPLTVQQYLGFQSNVLSSLQNYVATHAASYTAQTNFIDYTDFSAPGEYAGGSRWPAAEAQNVNLSTDINDVFFARVTGTFTVGAADTYTFRTLNDDGAFLLIDNTLVINDPTYHSTNGREGSIVLGGGTHTSELYFFENGGAANLEFSARSSSGSFSLVGTVGNILGVGIAGNLTDKGTISFTDVDLTDTHSLSAITPSAGVLGTLNASVTTDTTGSGTGGVITWSYSVPDSAVEYLAAGQTKVETFSFNVLDNRGASVARTVNVTITGTNDAPVVAVADVTGAVTERGAPAGNITNSGTIAFTDVDLTDTHSVSAITPSAGALGTLTASVTTDSTGSGTGGVVTWNYSVAASAVEFLAAGQTRVESFSFKALDGHGGSVTRTVDVTITGTNDGPVAVADTNAGDAVTESGVNPGNTTLAGDATAAGNVLTNDTDVDSGDTKTVTTTGTFTGTYGSLSLAANGSYTYTLNNADTDTNALAQGQSASDVFNYTLRDAAGATSSSTLTITITGTNDLPVVAAADVTGAVTEQVTPAGSLNDSGAIAFADVDLTDAHGISVITPSAGALGTLTASVTTDTTGSGAGGVVTWNYSVAASAVEYLTAGQTKGETFSFNVLDGNGGSVARTVSMTITGTNDVATVSSAYVDVTEGDAASALNTSGQLIITDPDTGEAHIVAQANVAGTYGAFSINVDGAWTYNGNGAHDDLTAGQQVQDQFTVVSQDGTATGTVTVTITGTNDAATVSSDSKAVTEGDTASALNTSGALAISDPDSGEAHVVAQTNVAGTYGNFSIDADGAWTYSGNGAHDELRAGQYVLDQFTVISQDGTATGALTVGITGANDAPVAVTDTLSATEDTRVTYTASQLLGNDTDVDNTNAQLSIASVTSGTGGTAVLNGDGTVTFTPNANFNGAASFTYKATDGTVQSNSATVTVNVAAVDDVLVMKNLIGSNNVVLVGIRDANGDGVEDGFTGSSILGGNSSYEITYGDFDKDGDIDLLNSSQGQTFVTLYKNTGDANSDHIPEFVSKQISVPAGAWSVFADDLDGDGDVDVLVGGLSNPDSILINRGDTNGDGFTDFTAVGLPSSAGPSYGVVTGDFNSDGYRDLVLSQWSNAAAEVRFGLGDTNHDGIPDFGSAQALGEPLTEQDIGFAVGDLDGDDDQDIVTTTWGGDKFVNFNMGDINGDGDAEFATVRITGGSDRSYEVLIADLDKDGDNDFVSCGNSNLEVFYNKGDTNQDGFTEFDVQRVSVGRPTSSISGADWDNDGDTDLALTDFNILILAENRGDTNGDLKVDWQFVTTQTSVGPDVTFVPDFFGL